MLEQDRNGIAEKAWQTLDYLLENEATPPAIRLRAALAVLRQANRPVVGPQRAERETARFDRLAANLAPHQALQRVLYGGTQE